MSELKISKATRLIAQECNDFLNTYLVDLHNNLKEKFKII